MAKSAPKKPIEWVPVFIGVYVAVMGINVLHGLVVANRSPASARPHAQMEWPTALGPHGKFAD